MCASTQVGPLACSAAGYMRDPLVLYSSAGQSFTVPHLLTGDRGLASSKSFKQSTGRGGPHDPDTPQGRVAVAAPALPEVKPWQPMPLNVEQARNPPWVIAADQHRE